MKKFFTLSFSILAIVSFVCAVFFSTKEEDTYTYSFNCLGFMLLSVGMLIKEIVPEEEN